MPSFLKIFPAHAQKPKSFPIQPVSINYVLFTSVKADQMSHFVGPILPKEGGGLDYLGQCLKFYCFLEGIPYVFP